MVQGDSNPSGRGKRLVFVVVEMSANKKNRFTLKNVNRFFYVIGTPAFAAISWVLVVAFGMRSGFKCSMRP